MNPFACTLTTLVAVMLLCPHSLGAFDEGTERLVKQGDERFRLGEFTEAEKAYKAALTDDAANAQAVLRLGEIALLSNRLGKAERLLARARKLRPDDDRPKSRLAEAFYRQDDFQQAAPLFRAVGRAAMAEKLESFKGVRPNQITGDVQTTRVKFVQTDLLPIIKARINGGEEVLLLIDTGGSELILDPEFAESLGLVRFGSETGTFAGGKKASFEHARIDSIQLSEFNIKNVPVHLQSTRRLPFASGGQHIDGILGTVLFYHFISTLDYPNGELVLTRKTDQASADLDTQAKSQGTHVIPFWMAGDHFMVAWGSANDSEPFLMLVDTGMAGGGFTCPESTIKSAGIDVSGPSFEGIGGGGPVKVTPFVVDRLTLGDARQSKITSFSGAFPPSTEYAWGFRVGGLISHAFFRPYALTFDFDRMRLYLTPGR